MPRYQNCDLACSIVPESDEVFRGAAYISFGSVVRTIAMVVLEVVVVVVVVVAGVT